MNSKWGLCDKDTEIKSTSKSNVSIHTLEGVTTPMTQTTNTKVLSIWMDMVILFIQVVDIIMLVRLKTVN